MTLIKIIVHLVYAFLDISVARFKIPKCEDETSQLFTKNVEFNSEPSRTMYSYMYLASFVT